MSKSDAERQADLQNLTDTTPLDPSPEVKDEGGVLHAPEATKKNGLPDEPLRRSIVDPDLIVSETSGRQFRRQWDADEDGVEITGSETWVEV